MPVIARTAEATHELAGTAFTSLAVPSKGTTETSLWRVRIEPGTPSTPHRLTREEIFFVLDGQARVTIAGTTDTATAGDTIVVPAEQLFEIANIGDGPLEALCCMPAGGMARVGESEPFVPPWTA